jgi:chromosome segregation ATPase
MRHDTPAPRDDIGLAAELRRQLDEALGRNAELERKAGIAGARVKELELVLAELQRERGELQARIHGIAEQADRDQEMPEARGSAFWMAAWREARRQHGEKALELVKQEQELATRAQWLKEYGEELARMQTRNRILQRIVDTVRGHEPTDTLGAVKVHHPDGGSSAWLFDAIDAVKGPTP